MMQTRQLTWLNLLDHITRYGMKHTKDDSPIREIIGVHEHIPNEFGIMRTLTCKEFLEWINNGFADIKDYPLKGEALADYVSSLDDEYMIDGGDFVYTYPERLFNYQTVDLYGEKLGVDQIELMVHRLVENPGSNRSVATLYNCGLDGVAEDIPCLNWIQALIREGRLILSVMFRSNDLYGAWPSNMLFLNCLGLRLVDELKDNYPGLYFSHIDYHCTSLHIYETDIPAVEKILDRCR